MTNENEPAKLLLPYLQRADELQKHDALVAYYCRLYAMERGLRIPQSERTKTTNALLVSLMKQLEKDKKSLKLGPDDSLHLEGFALNVFTKADKQDQAGRADLSTAKTFYAAIIFFEILNQFGELQPDLEQKQKYAAWKAADIRKAIKEGRRPIPGPPGAEKDLSRTQSGEYDLEPTGPDPPVKPPPESEPSPRSYSRSDSQHFSNNFPPAAPSENQPSPPSNVQPPPSNIPPSPPNAAQSPSYPTDNYSTESYSSQTFHPPPSTNGPPNAAQSPSCPTDNYPTKSYSSQNFHPPPPTNEPENSAYSQPYLHQQYPQESQQNLPQNYPSHEAPSYSYPNFQSYPSFMESSLPSAPSHYPSYYQGADASYASPPASNMTNYTSTAQYDSGGRNVTVPETAPTSAPTYHYDSNYQPPPEKIAEAHKAARFAVGALAFDNVSIAVDYLKKSLELLTLPSAGQ